MNSVISDGLSRFESLIVALARHIKISQPAPGIFELNNTNQSNPSLMISTLIHGNEPGGLFATNQFLEKWLDDRCELPSLVLLQGNLEAYKKGVRFLETDLNRCFGTRKFESKEDKRARQIEEFVSMVPFTLDLHQTQQDSESDFFIYPATKNNISFASSLSETTPHILHGTEFSKDGETIDTYLTLKGRTAITYEMGPVGFDCSQIERTCEVIWRSLEHVQGRARDRSTDDRFFTWFKTVNNTGDVRLVDGLRNFSRVEKDDVIAIKGESEIRSQFDGYALFPKYGDAASHSSEIVRIISNIPSHDLNSMKQIENLESVTII